MNDLAALLRSPVDFGPQTVPDALIGCWRRNWIRHGDGEPRRDVHVVWLQTASGMGDVRIDPSRPPLLTDSSCGITVVDETTAPYPTARWEDGDHGFAQQPEPNFPEDGWLEWRSPTVMWERAPSGAYVEEWERLPYDHGTVVHLVAPASPGRTNLYIAGRHVFLAVERIESPGAQPLHEFSYATLRRSIDPASATIELSTIAERVGATMLVETVDLDHTWQPVSCRTVRPIS